MLDLPLLTHHSPGASWQGDSALLTHSGHSPPPRSGLGTCLDGDGRWEHPSPAWDPLGTTPWHIHFTERFQALGCFRKEFVTSWLPVPGLLLGGAVAAAGSWGQERKCHPKEAAGFELLPKQEQGDGKREAGSG